MIIQLYHSTPYFWGPKISMILTPATPKNCRCHGGFLMTIFNAIQGKCPRKIPMPSIDGPLLQRVNHFRTTKNSVTYGCVLYTTTAAVHLKCNA
jgi:hypothetical protein